MTLQSMTGFARSEGALGSCRWAWEMRSVNGKGLDMRIRLPAGLERLEPEIRKHVSTAFQRGSIQLTLSISRDETPLLPVINEPALQAVLEAAKRLSGETGATPPTIDGLLAIRGVLEFREPSTDAETMAAEETAILDGLAAAIADLAAMRASEGEKVGHFLRDQIDAVETLVRRVDADPSRTPEAIAERLAGQVRLLLDSGSEMDEGRLHMEAAILAAKADLREEVDRLTAHVEATRQLMAAGGAVGRRLDFLAQEFNRETNTICSKSNAASVTAIGLELKAVIDQFREQVQNLE